MKVPPAEMENREYASWKSLELLDTLLALADAGHSHAVMEMFQVCLGHTKFCLTQRSVINSTRFHRSTDYRVIHLVVEQSVLTEA